MSSSVRVALALLAPVLLLGQLVLAAAPAAAQGYEQALSGFAADSYSDTDAAISGVATSGNPLAVKVIEALQDGRLLFNPEDKKVYVREPSGRTLDAATGQPVAGTAPPGLKPVRLNNRLRRSVDIAHDVLPSIDDENSGVRRLRYSRRTIADVENNLARGCRAEPTPGKRRRRRAGCKYALIAEGIEPVPPFVSMVVRPDGRVRCEGEHRLVATRE